MSGSNDLTFIRCSSCRSLVPAVSSRCRMCGNPLRSDAPADSPDERKMARVRQPTASLSGVEADRLREDSEALTNYPLGQSDEVLDGESEGREAEQKWSAKNGGGIGPEQGVSEIPSARVRAGDPGDELFWDGGPKEESFEEEAVESVGTSGADQFEESEEQTAGDGLRNGEDAEAAGGEVELLVELNSGEEGESDEGGGVLWEPSFSSVGDGDEQTSAETDLIHLHLGEEEVPNGSRTEPSFAAVSPDEGGGWQDVVAMTAVNEHDVTSDELEEKPGIPDQESIIEEPPKVRVSEAPDPLSSTVAPSQRAASRPLHFGKRQPVTGGEGRSPREPSVASDKMGQAEPRPGKSHYSSPRPVGSEKGRAHSESQSPRGRTESVAPRKPQEGSARGSGGSGRGIGSAQSNPTGYAEATSSRLFGWLVSYKDSTGAAIELREGKTLLTGSSLKKGDLVIEAPSISTPHAMFIMRADAGLYVQDLMSERGIWVRRRQEDTYQREEDGVELMHGDWVRFGDEEFLVSLVPYVGVQ